MNKRWNVIGVLLVLLLFSYCGKRETQQIDVQTSDVLAGVDSLMWHRPDSALACLLPYFDTITHNRHYAHLLLAELLYKNDYAQTNRMELRQAVGYFDSLSLILNDHSHASWRHCGLDPQSPKLDDNIVFLTARAHYINGVGYYEKDSVVEACEEYLKALEVMESHFENKALMGHKARFMALTYGRLGEMFNEQLLAEPAITCYKQALLYCKREPTSIYGIPVLLYNLGIQFDVANQQDSAAFYYDKALANMPDYDNIHYRDIITSKSVLAFNLGFCIDSVINSMKYVISLTTDENERTCRFLTLGNILYESEMYDSSRFYLETVFEKQDDIQSKIVAAENLCNIYQREGDSVKARKYSSYLADFTMVEIEKKKDVSRINEIFKNHLAQKQEKQAEEERDKAIKRVIRIIISIAVVIILVIIVLAKSRSKKLIKEQQEEANRMLGETEQQHKEELKRKQAEAEKLLEDKEKHHRQEIEAKEAQARKELEEREKQHAEVLEAELQTHRMERAAISGRLKRKNQEVRELKDQIKQQDDLASITEPATSFNDEPVCCLVMERVKEGQFKSKVDYKYYKDSALDKQQLLDLRLAVDRHFGQFTVRLKKAYPELTNSDLDYCCLYLLGLTDADISALMQRTYNTVIERNGKMRKILGSDEPLSVTLKGFALDSLSI